MAILTGLFLSGPRAAAAGCDVSSAGSLAFGERIRDVELAGDHAFLAAGAEGVAVVDVADPAQMQVVATVPLGTYAHDVELAGSTLWAAASDADGLAGLAAIDVAQPAAPSLVGTVPGSFTGVALEGGHAYAIAPDSGLWIVDVSAPASAAVVGQLDLAGEESNVEVVGGLAYVTVLGVDAGSSIRVVDVSTPAAPFVVDALDAADRLPVEVHVAGGLAYVSAIGAARRGLILFDLAAPSGPAETAFLAQPGARDLRLLGSRAFFAFGVDPNFGGGPGGLRVIDVSDPRTPVVMGEADTSADESTGIAVQGGGPGDRVFASVSGSAAGLRVYEVSGCPRVESATVTNPTPVTVPTVVPFTLHGSASLDASAYDVGSLAFGPDGAAALLAPPEHAPALRDEDGDGFDDLVVHFDSFASGLAPGMQQACVEGLLGAEPFLACDWVEFDLPPDARFEADLAGGLVPLTASFDAGVSVDPEAAPLSYQWTFSDGPTSSAPVVTRDFTVPTAFDLSLVVTDARGQVSELTRSFQVFEDTDGDGIHDGIEMGPDPESPLDTDGDGVPDYLDLDSDGDGLPDAVEDPNGNGVAELLDGETDRTRADTDGDGFHDLHEIRLGANPRSAVDFPPPSALPVLGVGAWLVAAALAATGRRAAASRRGSRGRPSVRSRGHPKRRRSRG